jgi:AraC-like DNA-binding protein
VDRDDFEILAAPAALRPFVRRFLHANRPLAAPYTMRPKPTGYVYFSNVFDLDPERDLWVAVVDGVPNRLTSRWNFAGQIVDHDIRVEAARGRLSVIFAELSATALYRLFGMPAAEITGRAVPVSSAGADFESAARECFVSGWEQPAETHVAECDAFFSRLVEVARPGDIAVEHAVTMFERADGAVRVADICKEVGIGPRQLVRRFTTIVGVGPKFFGQILQINWVVGALFAKDTQTLAAIAHDAGFYDQAHFNHAMQRFFSQGPSEFLKSDHVAFKEFLGASRLSS